MWHTYRSVALLLPQSQPQRTTLSPFAERALYGQSALLDVNAPVEQSVLQTSRQSSFHSQQPRITQKLPTTLVHTSCLASLLLGSQLYLEDLVLSC